MIQELSEIQLAQDIVSCVKSLKNHKPLVVKTCLSKKKTPSDEKVRQETQEHYVVQKFGSLDGEKSQTGTESHVTLNNGIKIKKSLRLTIHAHTRKAVNCVWMVTCSL